MISDQQNFKNNATSKDGALAGLIATLPMSVVMLALHKLFPPSERYPLPPEQITSELADRAGAESAGQGPMLDFLAGLAHFGFGTSAGSLFIPIAKVIPLPPLLTGLIYGFLVWFVSYQGWIPRARLLPPASREPTRRNLLMIVAHLVWGGVLVWLLERWTSER